MSTSRTILSRPWRSLAGLLRRVPGRYLLVGLIVFAVSACAAVAAEGLPSGGDDRTQTVVAAPIAPASTTTLPQGVSADSLVLPVATTAVPTSSTVAPETTVIEPVEPISGPSTIVAHATVATVVARQAPSETADPVADFANPTDRGGPLVFQALGEPVDGWLEVLLPVRPNGTTGWIPLDEVSLTRNPYRIEVDLENYELTITRNGEVELSAPVAIGQGGTPTPIGDFYLIELLQPIQRNGPYGSYAYGLSGYSDVLDNFNGGDGVIGIHGTNQPNLLGGPASHGCIRVHNDTIELMANFLPLGTPVSIMGVSG